MNNNVYFTYEVMEFIANHDIHNYLWWTFTPDNQMQLFINCNDIFYWGCGDLEEITQDNFHVLKKAMEDCEMDGPMLFCARVREMRPQGAAYSLIDKENWHFFDAAGPEREVGFDNPQERPE